MNYEITYDTELIIPIDDKCSKVIENGEEYIIDNPTLRILEHSCEYFGSSLEGRQIGTSRLVGFTHKVPIIIAETFDIIFFPTLSPKNGMCAWLAYNHIFLPEKFNDKSLLQLKNGKKILVDVSPAIIHNQLYRCSRLKDTLFLRKNDKN